ncbi:MAG: cyclic nucleotide-binding domain-containing protein [Candidatus Eremiobacteraeota bacterium]|nr:cyclic nucleotide-binding domain-containing protein [Candidatus Eremiobacteraeota bacterium]
MHGEILRHAGADVEDVRKGQTVFVSGAIGTHMYIVIEGQIEIRIGERVVDIVSPGGIFGEMALLDDRPRAATAISLGNGKLLRMDEKQFLKLVRESPEFSLKVLRTVVERERRADALGGIAVKKSA